VGEYDGQGRSGRQFIDFYILLFLYLVAFYILLFLYLIAFYILLFLYLIAFYILLFLYLIAFYILLFYTLNLPLLRPTHSKTPPYNHSKVTTTPLLRPLFLDTKCFPTVL